MILLISILPTILLLVGLFSVVFIVLLLLVAVDIIKRDTFKLYLRRVSLIFLMAIILVLLYSIITNIFGGQIITETYEITQ